MSAPLVFIFIVEFLPGKFCCPFIGLCIPLAALTTLIEKFRWSYSHAGNHTADLNIDLNRQIGIKSKIITGALVNKTIENTLQLFEKEHVTAQSDKCDHRIADPIIQTVSHEKDIIVVPKWKHNQIVEEAKIDTKYTKFPVNDLIKTSDEKHLNLEKELRDFASRQVIDDSIQSSSLEQVKFIDDNLVERELFDNSEYEPHSVEDHKLDVAKVSEEKVSEVDVAPFLVALFESVEDVTAQTCGGTIVSPHWVLTAAKCIGMLRTLYYMNITSLNATAPSEYTVIANTSNPFSEGTVHNVTEIHLHPDNASDTQGFVQPSLAMLRVEPAIDGQSVEVAAVDPPPQTDVRVYGWMLRKEANSTEQESIQPTSFSAKTLSTHECKASQNVSLPVICLYHDATAQAVSADLWMSSGGPVISRQGGAVRALGVATADAHLPVAAAPAAEHKHWIQQLILNT